MNRLLKMVLAVEGVIATLAYCGVAILLLGDVIAREIFQSSIWGAQKVAVYAAIVAGVLGFSMAVAHNSHIRPSFADGLLPSKLADRAGDLLAALIYLAFGWYAAVFVGESITFNTQAPVLYIPVWPIQLVLPYAFLASALRYLIFAIDPSTKPGTPAEN